MRTIASRQPLQTLENAWTRDADWLTAQYNNRALVPEHAAHLERWARESARVRAGVPCRLNVAYAPGVAGTLDVFAAARPSGALVVFIHGGYWRALSKDDMSFVVPAFTQAGVTVVVPEYPLCPGVAMDAIALQLTRAVSWSRHHAASFGCDPGRITVAGHSAGGHLAAMMLACDWSKVDAAMPANAVRSALSLSGVFDLEPLRHAPFLQDDLQLTPALVSRLSPARFAAPAGHLRAVVGGDESGEFHRQTQLIEAAWTPAHVPACAAVPGCNHFTILDELARVGSSTHRLAMAALL